MSLYLVRHTTPAINPGICYGQTDLGLANSAQQELDDVRRRLPEQIAKVYSSPLRRCTALAHRLVDTPIQPMPELCELDFGDWEMQAWDQLPRADLDYWAKNVVDHAPTNGESLKLMQQRVLRGWKEICASQSAHGNTVVVTHAGVIRVIHAFEQDWPVDRMFELKIPYGGILQLSHGYTRTKPALQIL